MDCLEHKCADFEDNHLFNWQPGLVVTVDHARETSHIYLTTMRNINGMVYFINTNYEFNVYVDRNNASITLLSKSYCN